MVHSPVWVAAWSRRSSHAPRLGLPADHDVAPTVATGRFDDENLPILPGQFEEIATALLEVDLAVAQHPGPRDVGAPHGVLFVVEKAIETGVRKQGETGFGAGDLRAERIDDTDQPPAIGFQEIAHPGLLPLFVELANDRPPVDQVDRGTVGEECVPTKLEVTRVSDNRPHPSLLETALHDQKLGPRAGIAPIDDRRYRLLGKPELCECIQQAVDQQLPAAAPSQVCRPRVLVQYRRGEKDLLVEIRPHDPGRAVGVELEELEVVPVEERIGPGDHDLPFEAGFEQRKLLLIRRETDGLPHLGVHHVLLDQPLGAVEQDSATPSEQDLAEPQR